MPLSGRKRKLDCSSAYESKFCEEGEVNGEESLYEGKSGEDDQNTATQRNRRTRALRKLKNFYASSSGQVALGKMKFQQGKLSLVTPRLPDAGSSARNARTKDAPSAPPKLRKKCLRSKVGSSCSAEKENGKVSMFVISESKEAEEEDVGDEVTNDSGDVVQLAYVGGATVALGGTESARLGAFGVSSGSRTHREVARQRDEVPHTARLEAYCPPERKSKNVLFTPR